MLAGTAVYVNAGTQLARIESLDGILSPGLIGSFVLLGIFPWVARRGLEAVKSRRALGKWPKPRRFDWDLVVVGAGSAGLVSSLIGATLRARVALVERDRMGGDCLNTGCVPSKALIRTTRLLAQIRNAKAYGIRQASAEVDFTEVMERVRRVIRTIEPHDSPERYRGLGVECIAGEAALTSPYTVEVGGKTLTTRNIVIATGAGPLVPPIPGLERVAYRTSDTIWDLDVLPESLLVLGGGAIGCELAQCFARLGSRVTQVEMLPRLLAREDEEVSEAVARRFREEGIDIRVGHTAKRVEGRKGGPHLLICEHDGREVELPFGEILVALGRRPRVEGYGLEALGVGVAPNRSVEVNEYLQTACPNVYACGDVAGPYQFTHVASHQAWYATVNALFGSVWRFPVDYSVIPWATFTDPEVARVGINALEASERGIDFEVTPLPPFRARPGHRGRGARGLGESVHPAGEGPGARRDRGGGECRRSAHGIRERDAPSPRPEQDSRHHPHLSDAQRGEPLCGGSLAARPRPSACCASRSATTPGDEADNLRCHLWTPASWGHQGPSALRFDRVPWCLMTTGPQSDFRLGRSSCLTLSSLAGGGDAARGKGTRRPPRFPAKKAGFPYNSARNHGSRKAGVNGEDHHPLGVPGAG